MELYSLNHMTQEEVRGELNRLIDTGELDNAGRHVSFAWVRGATEGLERIQDDWSFSRATPEEVEVIAPIYEWAVSAGETDPWPNPSEADWWVKIRTLAPDLPPRAVFRGGRFAALRRPGKQQEIAEKWMLWSVRGEAERQQRALPTRVTTASHQASLQVGGTAIADMYDED